MILFAISSFSQHAKNKLEDFVLLKFYSKVWRSFVNFFFYQQNLSSLAGFIF